MEKVIERGIGLIGSYPEIPSEIMSPLFEHGAVNG
jgi:hypothetical protein